MPDQANQLRQLIHVAGPCARDVPEGPAMVVVAGGRAGVGATTVAVNLATVMADRMRRVLLVDAVEERSGLMAAAGVRRSGEYCLADVLGGKCEIGDAVVDGPGGMMVLTGSRVSPTLGREFSPRRIIDRRNSRTWGRRELQRLMCALDLLRGDVDLIVVDAGCGLSAWSRRFWLRAQMVVLVTTADGPAILDSYAMLKRSVADATGPEIRLLVNQCSSDGRTAEAQRRFSSACERFLGRAAPALPSLPRCEVEDASVGSCLRVWESPDAAYGRAMLWLGRAVANAIEDKVLCATACGGRTRMAS